MKILHTSDLHGRYYRLLSLLAEEDFDLWVDTGDFFPNKTRGNWDIEPDYQRGWFKSKNLGEMLVDHLNGRPLISVGGNHDYTNLVTLVKDAGGRAFDVTLGRTVVGGLAFSGFREIPWIVGEWRGETHDFAPIVEKAMKQKPDILVTHSPPAGILDASFDGRSLGVPSITTQLTYTSHKVRAHLFGHVHDQGEKVVEEIGIMFSNAATGFNVLYL